MLHLRKQSTPLAPLIVALFVAAQAFIAHAPRAAAAVQKNSARTANANNADGAADEPPYREYKGVHIGMSAEEARQKLGAPQDKSEKQDFYIISENETAQVFYEAGKVTALAVIFVGKESTPPTAKSVFGSNVEAKPDGSIYRLERYRKAGYWVSYSRSSGDAPVVSVTMQKF